MIRRRSFGNDIVDLKSREKPLHERFLERVYSAEEQVEIARDPVSIWRFWAAKEAAFKTVARFNPETVFAHRPAEIERAFPEFDIMKFASGEVVQQRAPLLLRHHAQIGRMATLHLDTAAIFTEHLHARDKRQGRERGNHRLRIFPGGNDYPAKEIGLDTVRVRDPEDTLNVIAAIVACQK